MRTAPVARAGSGLRDLPDRLEDAALAHIAAGMRYAAHRVRGLAGRSAAGRTILALPWSRLGRALLAARPQSAETQRLLRRTFRQALITAAVSLTTYASLSPLGGPTMAALEAKTVRESAPLVHSAVIEPDPPRSYRAATAPVVAAVPAFAVPTVVSAPPAVEPAPVAAAAPPVRGVAFSRNGIRYGNWSTPSPAQLSAVIARWAGFYGQDADLLVRVAICESSLDHRQIGKDDEVGVLQFLDTTFYANARYMRFSDADLYDPEHQARIAAWMFSQGQAYQWTCYRKITGQVQ